MQPEASQEVKDEMARFVGIDIGKAKCRAAIVDPGGVILEEFTFTYSRLRALFEASDSQPHLSLLS